MLRRSPILDSPTACCRWARGPDGARGNHERRWGILPPRAQGEIVVRGDIVMDRYFDDPEGTRQAQLYGWHHTGDIGFKDEDGFIYVVDRKKEMIISGGFNIFPPGGRTGRHDPSRDPGLCRGRHSRPKWGEAVMATVELRPGAELDVEQLLAIAVRAWAA